MAEERRGITVTFKDSSNDKERLSKFVASLNEKFGEGTATLNTDHERRDRNGNPDFSLMIDFAKLPAIFTALDPFLKRKKAEMEKFIKRMENR